MNHSQALNIIARLEGRFAVNDVTYKSVRIWPLIRENILRFLLGFPVKAKNPQSVLLQRVLHFLAIIVFGMRTKWWYNRSLSKNMSSVGNIDLLFFSRVEDHFYLLKNKYINPLIDSLIKWCRPYYTIAKMELQLNGGLQRWPRSETPFFVNPDLMYSTSIQGLKGIFRLSENLENINVIANALRELDINYSLNEKSIIVQMEYILHKSAGFELVLNRLRPRAVFFICSYYADAIALLIACRKLQIKSVELLHGTHVENFWTNIPSEGYEMLPDFYWTWNEEARRYIASCQNPVNQHQCPVLGGNPWLSAWIHGDEYEEDRQENKDYYELLNKYSRVIIYSLQPIAELFPSILIEAMCKSPEDWIWLIRLHPHNNQRARAPEIGAELQSQGIRNFEIKHSAFIMLPSILKRAHHHITCWSAVGYEASCFRVPTTIIHPNGAAVFCREIERGTFSYADSSDQIIENIRTITPDTYSQPEPPLIETAPEMIYSALKRILS